MTEPGGVSLRRRWTGRHYAHLLLPVPFLTDPAVAVLDAAVTAADGWRPYGDADPAGAAVARRWHRRPAAGTLRLAVLGWYPLLVTVGADPAGGRAARRALGRLVDAALSVDGRPLSDAELPGRLAAAADRGAAAAELHVRAARVRADLTRRGCPACPAVSDRLATHCAGCDRRFTGADDERRDADHRDARHLLRYLAAELDRLARDRPMRARPDDATTPVPPVHAAPDTPVPAAHAAPDTPVPPSEAVPGDRAPAGGGAVDDTTYGAAAPARPGEPTDAARRGEPTDAARSGEPVDVALSGEPTDVAPSGEPTDVARSGEPVDVAPSGEATEVEPARPGAGGADDPAPSPEPGDAGAEPGDAGAEPGDGAASGPVLPGSRQAASAVSDPDPGSRETASESSDPVAPHRVPPRTGAPDRSPAGGEAPAGGARPGAATEDAPRSGTGSGAAAGRVPDGGAGSGGTSGEGCRDVAGPGRTSGDGAGPSGAGDAGEPA